MKSFLLFLAAAFCTGCAIRPSAVEARLTIPSGAEALLENAYRMLDAYQRDDAKVWSELVCGKNATSLSTVKFLGTFTPPRLVSVSSVSTAGNSNKQYVQPAVAIEVKTERYLNGNLLLRFVEDAEQKCVVFIV
jgi:hypothetical protein